MQPVAQTSPPPPGAVSLDVEAAPLDADPSKLHGVVKLTAGGLLVAFTADADGLDTLAAQLQTGARYLREHNGEATPSRAERRRLHRKGNK